MEKNIEHEMETGFTLGRLRILACLGCYGGSVKGLVIGITGFIILLRGVMRYCQYTYQVPLAPST